MDTSTRRPNGSAGADGARTRRLSLRLGLGALAAVLVAVPLTLLTVLVLGKSATLERADAAVANAFHDQVLPRPWLARTFEVLADVTNPNTWRLVALVIAIVLWRRGRRRLVGWLVVTMAVGGLLGPLLKEVVARARPAFEQPIATADGYSFPSGHALNSMLFAAVLLVLGHPATRGARRLALWATALVIVAVTAADRLALGVHYASDVLAGWVVALATICTTTAAFAVWRTQEGLPAPSPESGLEPERSTS
jgi:undecaprenyl-diphosphatase